ncbi:hypothetical protein CYMTET_47700 [Cymbomonas tetramitiformis]|uniref:Uncharacterized protein n=1 Tax=Cymbomonas tetramitiformis TaxID=36881 RepID=A0AAE0EVT3_9CHLO|nr:hypothetical protein CYMTET_47700 [Cymbomonas tetramitiformis]|eukprot:gene5177-6298_t
MKRAKKEHEAQIQTDKRHAHDTWMKIVRNVEKYTEEPEDEASYEKVTINNLKYRVAFVGSTHTLEEHKRMLCNNKATTDTKPSLKNVRISHAYRIVKKEFADNEYVQKYGGVLYQSYVAIKNYLPTDNYIKSPITLTERINDENRLSFDAGGKKNAARWSEFDNFPVGSTHPVTCVRFYHNQIRPRSGSTSKRTVQALGSGKPPAPSKGQKRKKAPSSEKITDALHGTPPKKKPAAAVSDHNENAVRESFLQGMYETHVLAHVDQLYASIPGNDYVVPSGVFVRPDKNGHTVVSMDDIPTCLRWNTEAAAPQHADTPPPEKSHSPPEQTEYDEPPLNSNAENDDAPTSETVQPLYEIARAMVKKEFDDAVDIIVQKIAASIGKEYSATIADLLQRMDALNAKLDSHTPVMRAIKGVRKDIRAYVRLASCDKPDIEK